MYTSTVDGCWCINIYWCRFAAFPAAMASQCSSVRRRQSERQSSSAPDSTPTLSWGFRNFLANLVCKISGSMIGVDGLQRFISTLCIFKNIKNIYADSWSINGLQSDCLLLHHSYGEGKCMPASRIFIVRPSQNIRLSIMNKRLDL